MPALKEYTCPNCRRLTILDSTRPLEDQRCHLCTEPLLVNKGVVRWRSDATNSPDAEAWLAASNPESVARLHEKWLLWVAMLIGIGVLLVLGWMGIRLIGRADVSTASQPAFVPLPAAPYYDAKTLATQVLAAPSVDALLPLMRQVPGIREMMSTWRFPLGGRVQTVSPVQVFDGHSLQRVNLTLESGRHLRLFVENRDGKFLTDWPSFVGTSDLTMAQLLQQRPTSPVLMRVLVATADHAVAPFEDARKWFCIKIFAPGQEESCHGYLALDNPALASLTRRIPLHSDKASPAERAENEGLALPLALRVAFPKDTTKVDQVEVVEVLGHGWFIP